MNVTLSKFHIEKTLGIYTKELPHIVLKNSDKIIVRIPVDVRLYERVKYEIDSGMYEEDTRIVDILHNTKCIRRLVEDTLDVLKISGDYNKFNIVNIDSSDQEIFSDKFYIIIDPDKVKILDDIEKKLITSDDNLERLVYFDYTVKT